MANKFAEAWASIVHGIGNGLSFANDLMDDATGYAGELAVKWAAWLGRGLANTIDFAGDVAAWATDMVSWGINAALGTPENASDYSSKEWFLDKANKHVQGGFDQIEDATKSKLGKTFLGEKWSDLVGFVGELASPMGIVGKAGKGAKIAKEYIQTVKNSPKVLSELKALVIKAKEEGREVIQSEIDDVLSKSWIAGKNIVKDTKWVLDKNLDKHWSLDQFDQWVWLTQKHIDDALKNNSKEDILKVLDKRVEEMATREWLDVNNLWKFDDLNNPLWDSKLDDIVKETDNIRDMVMKSSVAWWKSTVLDPKTARFLEKVASYSPEEVASKWPKIAAMMKAGKFAGKVAIADVLREMSQPEIDAIEEELNAQETPNTPVKENGNSDGITFPDMPTSKDFNPSEWSKFNKTEDTQTITDKKKELELIKEKNAWSLNMSTSVVDLMKGLGVDSKQEARKIIFEKMTGKPYTASADDNIQLKSLIEEAFSKGILPDYFPSLKR